MEGGVGGACREVGLDERECFGGSYASRGVFPVGREGVVKLRRHSRKWRKRLSGHTEWP